VDDDQLTERALLMRVALPYLAVSLCLAVAVWITWSRLF
jgi:hypothetical protein